MIPFWLLNRFRLCLHLPKELMHIYHSRLTDGLKYFNPAKDEYGYPVGIGYIMPNIYPVNSES